MAEREKQAKRYPTDLTDAEWEIVRPFLPVPAKRGRKPTTDLREAGQVSDYTGAAALLDDMPKAQWLLGDRSYDLDWLRDTLRAASIEPCIRLAITQRTGQPQPY